MDEIIFLGGEGLGEGRLFKVENCVKICKDCKHLELILLQDRQPECHATGKDIA